MKMLGKKVNNEIETICAYECYCSCDCYCNGYGAPEYAVITSKADTVDNASSRAYN